MNGSPRTIDHATCLGCGCTCDDIRILVADDRIIEAGNACTLGTRWFGDGAVPARNLVEGIERPREEVLRVMTDRLASARQVLLYLAPDLSIEAQREAIALADRLGARADGVASDTVAESILAGQRRGRAAVTLGEVLNRADVLLFWGVDPQQRYPRYLSRYAAEPKGLFTPEGRRSRTIISADIGEARGPADADFRIAIAPGQELDALAILRASARGNLRLNPPGLPAELLAIAERLAHARYAVIVNDAEPGSGLSVEPARTEALIALAQALNGPTRAALSTLRAGGNRSGAEAVMLWQTGFPFAVDFARGFPRYRPEESAGQLVARGGVSLTFVVGSAAGIPDAMQAALKGLPAPASTIILGPRASEASFPFVAAIDTGIAGIHEGGTVYRMDDIPLPLHPALPGPAGTADILRTLAARAGQPTGVFR